VPFNHNDHYHPLLLGLVPPGAGRALDVGCGTGVFARALAARGLTVDALDADEEVIAAAKATEAADPAVRSGEVRYAVVDVARRPPPPDTYDFISCVASLHHLPFATVTGLRDSLRPGGVLAVLGLSRGGSGPRHVARVAPVAALNLVMRAAHAVRDARAGTPAPARPPVRDPEMTFPEVRERAAELLPGSVVSPRLFWRYVLAYRRP
jgi:SAM-dependent methyltransferase